MKEDIYSILLNLFLIAHLRDFVSSFPYELDPYAFKIIIYVR